MSKLMNLVELQTLTERVCGDESPELIRLNAAIDILADVMTSTGKAIIQKLPGLTADEASLDEAGLLISFRVHQMVGEDELPELTEPFEGLDESGDLDE